MSHRTKTKKILARTAFVTGANELEDWLENLTLPNRGEIRRRFEAVSQMFEHYVLCGEELTAYLEEWGEVDRVAAMNVELEATEKRYRDLEMEVTDRLANMSTSRNSLSNSMTKDQSRQISMQAEIQRLTQELETTFETVKKEIDKIRDGKQDRPLMNKNPMNKDGVDPATPEQQLMQQQQTPQQQQNKEVQHEQQPDKSPLAVASAAPDDQMPLSSTPFRQELSSIRPVRFDMRPAAPIFQPRQITESTQSSTMDSLNFDSSRLLERVHVPKFNGEKRNYGGWRAAFLSCVDRTSCTAEYKLLRLHNSLQGEALKVVENLGYSATAYNVAMERLERKYGGKKRQVMLRLEELGNFKPIRDGFPRDVEKFAELLDVLVVNLRDAGQENELGSGSLYVTLQRKLSENMLSRYYRWIHENRYPESCESLYSFVNQEAEFMITASEAVKGLSPVNNKQDKPQDSRTPARRDKKASTFVIADKHDKSDEKSYEPHKKRFECPACTKTHGIWACDVFKGMKVDARWNVAKENKLCFRCLSNNHFSNDCVKGRICGLNGCKSYHHRLLHEPQAKRDRNAEHKPVEKPRTEEQENSEKEKQDTKERAYTSRTPSKPQEGETFLSMRTVPVIIRNGERQVTVNALLDEASTRTYLNGDVAAQLNLDGEMEELTVNTMNNHEEKLKTSHVNFVLCSIDEQVERPASAYTTDKITGDLQVVNWNKYKGQWKHLQEINFPAVGKHMTVDLLIGLDHADLMTSEQDVSGESGEPIARLTPLGWTCVGSPHIRYKGPQNTTNVTFFVKHQTSEDTDDLGQLLRRYWEIDGVKQDTAYVKPDEKEAILTAESSLTYDQEHYSIGIPWRLNKDELTNNYSMAARRLQNTETKLLKNENLGRAYCEVIKTYEEKGYIRKVPVTEHPPEQSWYLPHFPVTKYDRSTTKVRIVFDASAKYEGLSLNDVTLPGPKLQNDLQSVLLKFRREPIGVMCDISEMYLQIHLKEADRPYHRFLWRSLDQGKDPEIYEWSRVVFGVNSSPFLAQFVSQEHAKKHEHEFPLGAATVLKNTYMDDSITSVPDVQTGKSLCQQLRTLWQLAGMHPHKWLSNEPAILGSVPAEDFVKDVDLDHGTLPPVKTLGILWSPKQDEFKYQTNIKLDEVKNTKRDFLSKIATLYDPLGFLQPYTITAKILLQEMWRGGHGWDEILPTSLKDKAKQWFCELTDLTRIRIPRCVRIQEPVVSVTLHTFVDASQDAYGGAVYTRHQYEDGTVTCQLVASKAKVAPLEATSVPRLELMAAVVGLRLTETVAKCLEVNSENQIFWSDSMDVLYWVRGQSRNFKPFVANRVGEIQRKSCPDQWRHVPTAQNPADHLTRGLSVSALQNESKWWNGPSFLQQGSEQWPKNNVIMKKTDIEIKKSAVSEAVVSTFFTQAVEGSRLDPKRFSSWKRMTRVKAWVDRFVENCRLSKEIRRRGLLEADEISTAERYYIRLGQRTEFEQEIQALNKGRELSKRSELLPLKPLIDEEGLLRCNGRLRWSASVPWEMCYPIILPRNGWISQLIIRDVHNNTHHGGTNQVLAKLTARYWIIRGREAIRAVERMCMECRRKKTMPVVPEMAPLPEIRTRESMRAFVNTSVDFGGPFNVKQGRGKARLKRYLCLFTCLSTRAVHLEVATSLDTNAFLNAFYRMTSRRGLPKIMYSDNGTNFVGANNELIQLKELDRDKIKDKTSSSGVKWKFNPPLAPHFNGVHEVMIKAAKRAINAILGSAEVTDEELQSAVIGAEGLINSRPLTYQSANPQDIVPLTPNHFIHGQIGGEFAPQAVDEIAFNPKKRWRHVQDLVRSFWKRWLREWIPSLNPRKKWFKNRANLKEGDVVLVMSTDTPRGKWPLGRITRVFPGQDGLVRVVELQVKDAIMKRPVVKICPLECTELN